MPTSGSEVIWSGVAGRSAGQVLLGGQLVWYSREVSWLGVAGRVAGHVRQVSRSSAQVRQVCKAGHLIR
jgi:hypothetical protein